MAVVSIQLHSATDGDRARYWWGALFAAFFFVFTLLAVVYAPDHTGRLMRHGVVFFSDRRVLGLFLGALFFAYTLFYLRGAVHFNSRSGMRLAAVFTGLFCVFLIISPPFFSSDLYGYITRAAIANIHHVNPYFVTPGALGYESVVAWADKESVYGPLFTALSLGVTKLVGSSIVANLVAFRLLAVAAFAGCAYLVYKIVGIVSPDNRYRAFILFAWNPFIIIESVNSAHNDVYMMFFILFSIYFVLRRWYVWAAIGLTVAFLVKFSTIALLPLLGLIMLKQPIRKVLRDFGWSALAIVSLVALAYLPFHNFSANLTNLGSAFITGNNLTFPQSIIYVAMTLADRLLTGFTLDLASLRIGYLLVFAGIYAWALFYRDISSGDTFIKRYFWVLLAFVTFLGNKFNIWYILWGMPLVLLVRDRRYQHLILFLTAYGFLYYITLNVFIPNVLFCVALGIYYCVVQWKTDRPRVAAVSKA